MSDEHVVYEQALQTVREATNQVVSTGGFFVIGYVTVIGFSFTNRSFMLLAAASIFMIVLWALLRRWQLILWSSLKVAEAVEPKHPDPDLSLAKGLSAWVGTETDSRWAKARWKVYAPLIVAALTIGAAALISLLVDSWSAAGNPA
jgi:hypothetical protein